MNLKNILKFIKTICAGCAIPVLDGVHGCKSGVLRAVQGVQCPITRICTHMRICAHPRVYTPMHTLHTLHNAEAARVCDFSYPALPIAHPAHVFLL